MNLPEIGGLSALVQHEAVVDKLDIIPSFSDQDAFLSLLIIPLAVQWWAAYYPGSEPGGGGYVVQRMLAAKDEKNAVGATLFFNIANYVLRPWPWILIALASLIIFPDKAAIAEAFPNIAASVVDDDLAYSAMLTYLPSGLLGIVIASLIAAFMSTISTHLNWGSSYIVNDFYKRFIDPEVSEQKMVWIGRLSTVLLMAVAAVLALFLQNAKRAFDIIVLMGAGTGLLFILRWFWWRINAYSELTAMVISFILAMVFKFGMPGHFSSSTELILGVVITTVAWVAATYLTPPVERETLVSFYQLIKPHSGGWRPVVDEGIASGALKEDDITTGQLPRELAGMFSGIFLVYSLLFSTGLLLYGNYNYAMLGLIISVVAGWGLWRSWQA